MIPVKVRRLAEGTGLALPAAASHAAAGLDLRAAVAAPITLEPSQHTLIPTGLAFELPEGVEGQVRPRSGLALKHGVTVLNAPGTIDPDYRGQVGVILANFGPLPFTVNRGDRIAQVVFARFQPVAIEEVNLVEETDRAGAGFGSTGVA